LASNLVRHIFRHPGKEFGPGRSTLARSAGVGLVCYRAIPEISFPETAALILTIDNTVKNDSTATFDRP